ncbi:DNA dC-_dU-editing enzyme APOBEC-3G-like isoform X2 [Elephas maximus indicus]|uniref:DNA dC->dU-editing enzyme APOBEC-3G-like isoform X2 n=1 Tax=Elephas maximus indicus TaxID=99487 RepID=UPI00211673FC|nr:DNA dC->dU-editing enzyme APOBEC-3G-like isoform X2 [Elephas maximus indicus]
MDRHTFIYNFKNFPFTTGRKKTYLCYEVQLMNDNFRNPQNWIKGFLYNQRNSHVSLNIFAARIYDCLEGYEEGLRSLYDAGAYIAIMTCREFEYCWRAFVDNQLLPFKPWYRLNEYSEFTSEQLQRILQQRVSYFPPVP